MTDEDVLKLVAAKTAYDLSPDEVEAVLRHIAQSPPLRDQFARRLSLQTYAADLQTRHETLAQLKSETNSASRKGAPPPVFLTFASSSILAVSFGLVLVFGLLVGAWQASVRIRDLAADFPTSRSHPSQSRSIDRVGDTPADVSNWATQSKGASVPSDASEPEAAVGAGSSLSTLSSASSESKADIKSKVSAASASEPTRVDAAGSGADRKRDATRLSSEPASAPAPDQVSGAKGSPPATLSSPTVSSADSVVPRGASRDVSPERADPSATAALKPREPKLAGGTTPRPSIEDQRGMPWYDRWADPGSPPAFETVCFELFNGPQDLPTRAQLTPWFDVLVGNPQGLVEVRTRAGMGGAIEGLVRLKAPWTEDSVWRFSLENYNRLQIHFFHGESGITLVYHEAIQHQWAAYRTVRQQPGFTPTSHELVATDAGRNARSEIQRGGSYELRVRHGDLILSRGDLLLLRAKLGGQPEDVLLQGKASVLGIAWLRTSHEELLLSDPGGAIIPRYKQPLEWLAVTGSDRPATTVGELESATGAAIAAASTGSAREQDDVDTGQPVERSSHGAPVVAGGSSSERLAAVARLDDVTRDSASLAAAATRTRVMVDWSSNALEGAEWVREADASAFRLVANRAPKRSWVISPRASLYPHAIVFEVDSVTPGAGIFLGSEKGPRAMLRYVRDRRSGRLCLHARGDDDAWEHEFPPLDERPLPALPARHWIRLLFSGEAVRWWFSPDGQQWVEPGEPIRAPGSELTHWGLSCVAQRDCELTLRGLYHEKMETLIALADDRLLMLAPPPKGLTDLAAWQAAVDPLKPAEWESVAWRRTMAVRTLAAPCPRSLAGPLVNFLADEAMRLRWPLQQQFRLLDQAACLLDLYDDPNTLQLLVGRYHQAAAGTVGPTAPPAAVAAADQSSPANAIVGIKPTTDQTIEPVRTGTTTGPVSSASHALVGRPYTAGRQALLRSPLLTRRAFPISTPGLVRAELLELLYASDWMGVERTGQSARFFHFAEQVPLTGWALYQAERQRGTSGNAGDSSSMTLLKRPPDPWRPVVVEQLGKETFNLAAELQALLESEAWDDAARRIISLDLNAFPGLTPSATEPQLLVTVSLLLKQLHRDHPRLSATIATQHAALANLRLTEAIGAFDERAVEAVTVLFPGTPSAERAYQWLAERALVAGRFVEARQYVEAAGSRTTDAMARTDGKIRRPQGETPTSNVEPVPINDNERTAVGGLQVSQAGRRWNWPVELAGLLQAADENPTTTVYAANGFAGPHREPPAPAALVSSARLPLTGPSGRDPEKFVQAAVSRHQVDWAGRQWSIVIADDLLIVNNRFHLAAYDLQTRELRWQSTPPAGKVLAGQDWALTPMRPLVVEGRIFTRQLYSDGGLLVCLNRETGQTHWVSKPYTNFRLISDPVWLHDALVCLTLSRVEQGEAVVSWTRFDPQTGAVWSERELLRVNEVWFQRQYCELQPVGRYLLAALGGSLICCTAEGELLWTRQQLATPPDEDSEWVQQTFSPPLVADHQVFLTQPGVWELSCLDLHTGEKRWSRTEPELRKCLGVLADSLIVISGAQLLALDRQTGKERWRQTLGEFLEGTLCGGTHGLMTVEVVRPEPQAKAGYPRFNWRDPQTGAIVHSQELNELVGTDLRLGPMFRWQNQVWTIFGTGLASPVRELLSWQPPP